MTRIFTNKYIILLFVITFFVQSKCECKDSYITICDSIADVYQKRYTGTSPDLLIQSEYSTPMTCLEISRFYFNLGKVRSLTIVGKINGFKRTSSAVFPDVLNLKYLNWYGNKLTKLKEWFFPTELNLKKLSLVNNEIEHIQQGTFLYSEIEEIDLSNNRIKVIKTDTFSNNIKGILIRNNELSHIEAGTFRPKLRYLSLDGNHVSRIQDNVFDNSSDLEEIHLSHNRLIAIPKVSNIPALQVLDVSYNRIETVNTDKLADSIRVVDLSHNIIHDVEFLANPFHSKKYPIKINLSFNLIRQVHHEVTTNITKTKSLIILSLFGNPWWCSSWATFRSFMAKDMHILQSYCDFNYFANGIVPYCISESVDDTDQGTKQFLKAVEQNEHLIDCNSPSEDVDFRFESCKR